MKKLQLGEKFDCKFDFRETCFGIVKKDNKILLVNKNGQYSLVGGGIEPNEKKHQCLKREYKEETGYSIKKIRELICVDCFWFAAGKYPLESKAHIFVAEIDESAKKVKSEEGHFPEFVDICKAMDLLPLPYQKSGLKFYFEETTEVNKEQTFVDLWDDNHNRYKTNQIFYDRWLDKYLEQIKKRDGKILELGAGLGNDTKYLKEQGLSVLATDLSEVSIESINQNLPGTETQKLDLTKPFPFEDNSFKIIVADLCLHYFSDKCTKVLMQQIKRVLSPNGLLLARVNSIEDKNHGAGEGKKIEENYYFVEGYNKRFFDSKDIKKYFGIVGDVSFKNADMLRYSKPKKCIEVSVVCKKRD